MQNLSHKKAVAGVGLRDGDKGEPDNGEKLNLKMWNHGGQHNSHSTGNLVVGSNKCPTQGRVERASRGI
jgi:hypothetical protein